MKRSVFVSTFILLIASSAAWAEGVPSVRCESRGYERSQNSVLTIDEQGNASFIQPGSDSPQAYKSNEYKALDEQESAFVYLGEQDFALKVDHKVFDFINNEVQGYDSTFFHKNAKGEDVATYLLCRYIK